MKKILFKTIFISVLIFVCSCNAQRVTQQQYINFYNEVTPKLNQIVPNKTQFYNQNFSSLYSEILNKNIIVDNIGVETKKANSKQLYILVLHFADDRILFYGADKQFQCPSIWITFTNEIPNQIYTMIQQNEGKWNSNYVTYFSNMVIEKIEFVGINGYKNPDRTVK